MKFDLNENDLFNNMYLIICVVPLKSMSLFKFQWYNIFKSEIKLNSFLKMLMIFYCYFKICIWSYEREAYNVYNKFIILCIKT